RPDERDVLAALDRERDTVEQRAPADPHGQLLGLDDRATAARRLQELESESSSLAREQVDLVRRVRALLLVPLDLAHLHLRLARHLLRRSAEARHESLQALDVRADPGCGLRRRL